MWLAHPIWRLPLNSTGWMLYWVHRRIYTTESRVHRRGIGQPIGYREPALGHELDLLQPPPVQPFRRYLDYREKRRWSDGLRFWLLNPQQVMHAVCVASGGEFCCAGAGSCSADVARTFAAGAARRGALIGDHDHRRQCSLVGALSQTSQKTQR